MGGKRLNIESGQKYNDWTVLHRIYDHGLQTTRSVWTCQCKCGRIRNIIQSDIPNSTRCSTCALSVRRMSYKKHGQSTCKDGKNGSRFYNIWSGMRTRCNNPKSKDYKWYGAKGISVCPEWNDFSAFYKWAIENGYDDNKTIDRKQSNGNYSPENCKWSTTKEQLQNRSCTRYVTIYGVTKTLSEWSEDTGINYQTLITRLRKKWPLENILDTPDRKNRPKIKDDDIPVEWPD